jgi:hypothetical protein
MAQPNCCVCVEASAVLFVCVCAKSKQKAPDLMN